ncbi:sugar phosphate isomerase/epimerase [Rathayibacter sp. VKM Ac-2929]|uniref:sugar phosphate isomerase/epimerase family protein n=1 Tax=Rathayibacter sp. VKM Ac-2929 TaxID=2929480 RepID=UPI001FB4B4BD|nr:sugar phosphate isomerase/epimerase [Rathayibacter sp. VKM Ac-2929]MCJ1675514.1 sugar phosphate isomerase/epimerase [Rathayibacter sp. VKM Ac-2929]
MEQQYGVDLITFYHPAFWGLQNREELLAFAVADPEALWLRIMAGCRDAGISVVEMTFAPADRLSALAAFGSPEAFAAALAEHGLTLKSGFFVDPVRMPDASAAELADSAAVDSDFIRRAGGDTLVVAPPMRRSTNAVPPLFVGLETMNAFADSLHAIGDASLRQGVKTAVHTEAHSLVCTTRDLDLLMALTDPSYVGLCPDTGHLVLSGSEPSFAVSRHRERVILSHWKDAIGEMPETTVDEGIHLAHREYFRRVGAGTVDWTTWAALSETTRVGPLILLELDAVPNPVEEMAAARAHLDASLA